MYVYVHIYVNICIYLYSELKAERNFDPKGPPALSWLDVNNNPVSSLFEFCQANKVQPIAIDR